MKAKDPGIYPGANAAPLIECEIIQTRGYSRPRGYKVLRYVLLPGQERKLTGTRFFDTEFEARQYKESIEQSDGSCVRVYDAPALKITANRKESDT